MCRPLAMEDAAEADEHEPHHHHQPEPPGHRLYPHPPGNRRPPGQALVVSLDGLEVLGHDPLRDVVVKQLFEAVFGGGVVERVDDGADEEEHQPPGGDGHRHQQHAVDEDEVGLGQGQAAAEEGDEDVGEDDAGEEEQGPGRGGVEADPVVLEDGDVRGDDPDRQAQERADAESLQAEGGCAHVVDVRRLTADGCGGRLAHTIVGRSARLGKTGAGAGRMPSATAGCRASGPSAMDAGLPSPARST